MNMEIVVSQKNKNGSNSVMLCPTNKVKLDFDILKANLLSEERLKNYKNSLGKFKNFLYIQKYVELLDQYVPLKVARANSNIKKISSASMKGINFDSINVPNKEENFIEIQIDSNFTISSILKLTDKKIINIEGTAGQGKSCILRYISISELQRKEFFPIFITFSELENHNLYQNIYKILTTYFSFPLNLKDEDISIIISNFKKNFGIELLLILDGFDELPSSYHSEIQEILEEFSHRYLIKVITSSRPWTSLCNSPRVESFQVSELNTSDIKNFINQYLEKEYADTLLNIINNNIEFTQCIKTPLLACLVVDNYQSFKSTPKTPKQFYNDIFLILLKLHDSSKEKEIVRDFRRKYSGLEEEKIINIFCLLCLVTLFNPKQQTHFSFKELAGSTKKILQVFQINDQSISDINIFSNDFINAMIAGTCLIVKDGKFNDRENAYTFCHKSIWEFYAAKNFESYKYLDWQDKFFKKLTDKLFSFESYYFQFYEFLSSLNQENVLSKVVLPYFERIGFDIDNNDMDSIYNYYLKYLIDNANVTLCKRKVNDSDIKAIESSFNDKKFGNRLEKRKYKKNAININIVIENQLSNVLSIPMAFYNNQELGLEVSDAKRLSEEFINFNAKFNKLHFSDNATNYVDKEFNNNQKETKSLKDMLEYLNLMDLYKKELNQFINEVYEKLFCNLHHKNKELIKNNISNNKDIFDELELT